MKNKFIALLLIFVVFVDCNNTRKKIINTSEKILFKGLATPVYMQKDSTKIILKDYILYPEKIDSFATNKHFDLKWNKTENTLTIFPKNEFQAIENLRIFLPDTFYDIPLFRYTKKHIKFTFPLSKATRKVEFKSQITGWVAQPMQKNNNQWIYETDLEPGNYQYLFVVNGKEILDPNNPNKISNGLGGYNSVLEIKDNSNKTPFLGTKSIEKTGFSIKFKHQPDKIIAYLDNTKIPVNNIKTDIKSDRIILPEIDKNLHYIRIYSYNKYGRGNDLLIPVKNGKVINNANELSRKDFHKQMMYFLMVDRFYNGDKSNDYKGKDSVLPKADYFGGDLQGIIDKIDDGYFNDLGINTIWISPITQNPLGAYGLWKNPRTKFSAYHGYWPISNTKIDFRFGSDSIFKVLLKKAHQNNSNVILDYVSNHVHKEHPLYKQHPDWATNLYLPDGTLNTEKWDSHRLTTWFDTFLPTLDYSKPEVVQAMTDSALYWVKHYDLDGFRHDATKHIQQSFWRTLTWKIKTQIERPIYQIGETYGSPELIRSYVNTGMLDGQFDFNLYDASVAVFAKKDESVQRLAKQLKESLKYYGSHHLMGNMTGNQDRVRFISYASGDVKFDEDGKAAGWTRNIQITDSTAFDKLAMLHAFNISIPGIPCIYYGDEIGMPGANDPDNRRMMKFNHLTSREKKLKKIVEKLLKLRQNSMALLYGTTKVYTIGQLLVIERKYFNDNVVFFFNKIDRELIIKQHSNTKNNNDKFTIKPGQFLIIRNGEKVTIE